MPLLHHFFGDALIEQDTIPHDGWFSFEGVALKWHYPLGLLYDLFSGATPHQAQRLANVQNEAIGDQLPWRITVHFTDWPEQALVRPDADGKVFHDAFINSVKEADFVRNGTAKGIMSLSKEDSNNLWDSVQTRIFAIRACRSALMLADNFGTFRPVFEKLLHAQGAPLRHVPIKVYLPSSPTSSQPQSGHLRVVQALVTPTIVNSREMQTIGSALQQLIPTIFPSRRTPILAKPVLHGVVVPLNTILETLMRRACYPDGWLHVGIFMIG